MNRKRWFVSGAVALVVASIAVALSTWMARGDDEGVTDAVRSLQTVSGTVGFQAEVPSFFPTSANRVVLVDSGAGPGNGSGGPLQTIEQIYENDQKFTFRGHELPSSIELFQLPARLNIARGERLAVSNASFELYRLVVDTDEAGKPVKVTYTALGANKSFVMDFTGEQPSDDGVVKMLESLRPVPKQTP